jgi:Zn-dependent membrane protease YugP
MYFYPYFDPMYFVFALPAILLVLFAQWRVQSTYAKYTQVPNARRVTGAQAAEVLLQATGLRNIEITGIPGQLTDHYDPSKKVLGLSQGVATTPSVAALGIVAHEVGHAVQDKEGYGPMRLRSGLVPVVNLGSTLGYIMFFGGIILGITGLAWLGIIFFASSAVFALVTLPVELDASRRALDLLQRTHLVYNEELGEARSVLSAAALTYVAALAQALSSLLYFVFILMGAGRRRD